MSDVTLRITATALSDWSIRAGYGLSKNIDSAIVRDSAGLPYIPAKTLVGVLRDNAEKIAQSLDGDKPGKWLDWVRYIFGSQPDRDNSSGKQINAPVQAALQASSLRMVETTNQEALAKTLGITPKELEQATSVIRTSLKIDKASGSAEKGMLRTEERARAGQVLRGEWTINTPDSKNHWPMWFLLRHAFDLTHSIGGKRRRGAGEFTFDVKGMPGVNNQTINFEDIPDAPIESPREGSIAAATQTSNDSATYKLRIKALSPLIVAPTKKGTVVTSSTYIPGAALLGIVQRTLGVGFDAIRDGKVTVTNAYPSLGGDRGMPWPLALTRKKDDHNGVLTNKCAEHVFDPKLKPLTGKYLVHNDSGAQVLSVERVSRSHVSIEPGRDPELFEYRAVKSGTEFIAEVTVKGISVSAPTTPSRTRIGTSSKDDYGDVEIAWEANLAPQPLGNAFSGGIITVSLESDVLLIGDSGEFDPSPRAFLRELERTLALEESKLNIAQDVAADKKALLNQITAIYRHDSWQTKWGLPRPTLIGLAAGSVLRIKTDEGISAQQLEKLRHGIGARTMEGYGRVIVNPIYLESSQLPVKSRSLTTEGGALNLDEEFRIQVLSSVLQHRASSPHVVVGKNLVPSGMTNTQMNKLRNLAMNMATETGQKAITTWFEKVEREQPQLDLDDIKKLLTVASVTAPEQTILGAEFSTLLADLLARLKGTANWRHRRKEYLASAVQPIVVNAIKVQMSIAAEDTNA